MGSPVAPSLKEATTCLMYLTYSFTVLADRFACCILSTSGFTVTLCTFAKGMSPMAGRIYLFKAASMLLRSLMGFLSRVPAQRK